VTPESFPSGWRALCHGARGDTSSVLAGGVLCASGHVVELELSGTGNRSGAMGLSFYVCRVPTVMGI
jgi:hypothetical protein